jgi:hypothetical protein
LRHTKIVLVSPLKSHLQIIILRGDRSELTQQVAAFLVVQLVDVLGERTERVNALPPRHWISLHNRMHSAQRLTHIPRTSSFFFVQHDLAGVRFSRLDEAVPDERRGQAFKELLVLFGAETGTVDFVGKSC